MRLQEWIDRKKEREEYKHEMNVVRSSAYLLGVKDTLHSLEQAIPDIEFTENLSKIGKEEK